MNLTNQPQPPQRKMPSTSKNVEIYLTQLGLLANLTMAIGKGMAGYAFHSEALLTDGLHSLTDLVADLIALASLSWPSSTSIKTSPRNDWVPNMKIESLGAVVTSALLLFGGVTMGSTALSTLYALSFASTPSRAPGDDMEIPSLTAAGVAAASILVKEWLYQTTIKVARERKSAVLASNAMHHRIDALTSIVALLTIGCAYVFGTAAWCDPLGKLVIALMVVKAGWGNTRQAVMEWLGESKGEAIRKLE